MYDVIIVGAGPAGMTAAIYAARREMKTLIIGKEIGGQLIWASEIENYPGFKSVSNYDLIMRMQEQVNGLRVEIRNYDVKTIIRDNKADNFIINTEKEKFIAKTVIIAMGLVPRRLGIPGEKEFSGKGVSYCANCDGPFFKNKIIAVIGGGNAALDAAEILAKIASKVYLVHRFSYFEGFEALVEKVKQQKNIEIFLEYLPIEITGHTKVEKIQINNEKLNKNLELNVDGVFFEIGRVANTELIKGLVKLDSNNMIIIDSMGRTSQDGLFAAGDVTSGPFKQITIATGQGTIAALTAYQFLQLKNTKTN